MHDLIFNYLKNKKISANNLTQKQILNLVSLSKKFHLIGFITSTYKLSDRSEHEELIALKKLSVAKNLMMMHDLKLICSDLNKKKIKYCILKGSALNVAEVYAPATRFFRDLDILVAKEDLKSAFKILNNLGYKYVNKFAKNRCDFLGTHHLPVMSNENGTFVELHHRATAQTHYKECPITENILKDKIFHKEIFIPNPSALIGHTLYHGLIHNRYSIGPIILFDINKIMKKYNLEKNTSNKYVSLLKLENELIKVNELFIDIENKNKINDLNYRLTNIRKNLALTEKESYKIHFFDFKLVLKKIINNFFYRKIVFTEFKYQTSRSSLKFPIFYLNELMVSIRNIRLF